MKKTEAIYTMRSQVTIFALLAFLLVISFLLIYLTEKETVKTDIEKTDIEMKRNRKIANELNIIIESALKDAVYRATASVSIHGGYSLNIPPFSVDDHEIGVVPYYYYEGNIMPIPDRKSMELAIAENIRELMRPFLVNLQKRYENFFLKNYTAEAIIAPETVTAIMKINADFGGVKLKTEFKQTVKLRLLYLHEIARKIVKIGFDSRFIEKRLINDILPYDPNLGIFCPPDTMGQDFLCIDNPPVEGNVTYYRKNIIPHLIVDIISVCYDLQNYLRRIFEDRDIMIYVKPMGRKGFVYTPLIPKNPPDIEFSFVGSCGNLEYQCYNRVDKIEGEWKIKYDLFFPVKVVIMDLNPSTRLLTVSSQPLTYVFYGHVYIKENSPFAASEIVVRDFSCRGKCLLSLSFVDSDNLPVSGDVTVNQCEFRNIQGSLKQPFSCGNHIISFFPEDNELYSPVNIKYKLTINTPKNTVKVPKKLSVEGYVYKEDIRGKREKISYIHGIPPSYVKIYFISVNTGEKYFTVVDEAGNYNINIPEGKYLIITTPNWFNGLPVRHLEPSYIVKQIKAPQLCNPCNIRLNIEMEEYKSDVSDEEAV